MTSTSNQRSTSKLTGKLCRSAAVLGLAAIGSLSAAMVGSAVTATNAGAIPHCPPLIPVCTVTPSTRPPIADPGDNVLDPTVDPTPPVTTPPTTPPSTTPPDNGGQNTNNPPKTNTGGNANQTTNETPVPAAETTSVDGTKSAAGDSQSDDGGSSLPYIAIVGGIAALGAAGTGLYLRYGRRA